jgi:hypothetical protein
MLLTTIAYRRPVPAVFAHHAPSGWNPNPRWDVVAAAPC